MLNLHRYACIFRAKEICGIVNRRNKLKICLRHFFKASGTDNSRIVHKNIQSAVGKDSRIHHGGNRFFVRTLWSCYYGTEPLPEGDGALTGVIDYFGGKYTLRVTFREKEFPVTEGERFLYEGGGFGDAVAEKAEVGTNADPES